MKIKENTQSQTKETYNTNTILTFKYRLHFLYPSIF